MAKPLAFASLLLVSTALVAPPVFAQAGNNGGSGAQSVPSGAGTLTAPPSAPASTSDADTTSTPGAEPGQDSPDISVPGGEDIVVRGRAYSDPARDTSQVLTVLGSADIARTGEGDIAGALARVTGLSVVGNGFVYVRGLGDRYSLALLNGSPLPSPEPLKRVVPLDIFPTSIIASSLVQKSYSVNFPGEFGGGVINLTTKAIPEEPFFTIGASGSIDSETTAKLGYTYYGSKSDWTGFDNGERDRAPALQSYLTSGRRISEGGTNTQELASQLFTGRNSVVQRNTDIPLNYSVSVSGGNVWELGTDVTLGVIANFAYSNKWRTRDTIQQSPATQDLSQLEQDFRRVITDDRVVVNGLVGYGLEFGENKVRWTNLYIRDTLKQARLGQGTRQTTNPNATFLQQSTAWFERQLVDSQIVGEFKLTDTLSLDTRGGFANSQREAPNEIDFEYFRSNLTSDPLGQLFVNRLNNGQQGSASIAFSDLNENLWSGGIDLSWKPRDGISASIGYAYSDTDRRTERREFLVVAPGGGLPQAPSLLRPDLLLSRNIINFYGITLVDSNEANPVFDATLKNHAAYAQATVRLTDEVTLNGGVRYETAKQTVSPVQVFATPSASLAGTNLDRDYFLPAATLTYQINEGLQFRLNASKTIARPQFRELIFQPYFDPDSNRLFRGNPLLVDSQLTNYEGRVEWYFAREQRVSLSGFFKKIRNPIETFASANETGILSSFANAPSAILYGAEFEAQKFFDFDAWTDSEFWARRRLVTIANYTYSQSKLRVGASDTAAVFNQSANRATDYFRDGAPLTGQSKHLLNFEIGLEDRDALSQQTVLFSYATKRVTNRGANGQPDIYERPGIQLDLVFREGVNFLGVDSEIKFEARNITGQNYKEFQRNGANVVLYNQYDVGTTVSLGWSFNF